MSDSPNSPTALPHKPYFPHEEDNCYEAIRLQKD